MLRAGITPVEHVQASQVKAKPRKVRGPPKPGREWIPLCSNPGRGFICNADGLIDAGAVLAEWVLFLHRRAQSKV